MNEIFNNESMRIGVKDCVKFIVSRIWHCFQKKKCISWNESYSTKKILSNILDEIDMEIWMNVIDFFVLSLLPFNAPNSERFSIEIIIEVIIDCNGNMMKLNRFINSYIVNLTLFNKKNSTI